MQTQNIQSILFLCVANSARSQIAEGLAKSIFGSSIIIKSAGSKATKINPLAIQVMQEVNINIQQQKSENVTKYSEQKFDIIITLCAEEVCPIFLSDAQQMHWPLKDPKSIEDFRAIRDNIKGRLEVLFAIQNINNTPNPIEFHASIRVPDLAQGARFYAWLLNLQPKEWTHRYVVFVSEKLKTNFVILVDDGKDLHQDTLYHLGINVSNKQEVVDAHYAALKMGFTIHKPARSTWRGTPLHELWLKDPGGNLVEIYARMTDEDLKKMPADKEQTFLIERNLD